MRRAIGMILVGLCAGFTTTGHADSVPVSSPVTVPNGDFEATDAAPWITYGPTAAVTADDCFDGNQCFRLGLDGMGAPDAEAGIYQDVTVPGSGSVLVSARLAVDAALGGDTLVELKLESLVGEYATDAAFSAPAPVGTWMKRSVCLSLPPEQGLVARPVVVIRSPSGNGSGAVRIDGLTLESYLTDDCSVGSSGSDSGGCAGGQAGLASVALALGFYGARRRVGRSHG